MRSTRIVLLWALVLAVGGGSLLSRIWPQLPIWVAALAAIAANVAVAAVFVWALLQWRRSATRSSQPGEPRFVPNPPIYLTAIVLLAGSVALFLIAVRVGGRLQDVRAWGIATACTFAVGIILFAISIITGKRS